MSFEDTAFQVLPDEMIVEVLERTSPEGILKLCSTSTGFQKWCDTDWIWERMIKVHYPGFPTTDTPKEQFKALTKGQTTTYYIVAEEPDSATVATMTYPADAEGLPVWEVVIRGLPLPNGTKKWLGGYWSLLSEDYVDLEIFNDQVGAIQKSLEGFEYFVDFLREIADMEFGAVNNDTINDAAELEDLPSPFTKRSFAEALAIEKVLTAEDGQEGVYATEIVFRDQ